MIEFLSLFLGLTAGIHVVEVEVTVPVTRLEIRLDGARVAELREPPWRLPVDFGDGLLPHQLEAIVWDAAGQETARAHQWINLPRAAAEARLVLVPGQEGQPLAARLSWESLSGTAPSKIEISFDGQPLAASDPSFIELPVVSLDNPHFLTATLEFPGGDMAHTEATFGGRYGSEVQTELTAVPLRLLKNSASPTLADLQGWLIRDDAALPVAAVDSGAAEVVFVRDRGIAPLTARLAREARRVPAFSRRGPRTIRDPEYLRHDMQLARDDRVRFLNPLPEIVDHPRFPLRIFSPSANLSTQEGGLFWLLTRVPPPQLPPTAGQTTRPAAAQELASAVAVAGLRAAAGSRPRAVVLVLGNRPQDQSEHSPQRVRRYLEALRVPLHVWSGRPLKEGRGDSAWGESLPIPSIDKLRAAVGDLRRDLESQIVVWVEGSYLPSEIDLAPSAPAGIELAF